MFDFAAVHAAPVPVRVAGTLYQIPRFLLPELTAWASLRSQEAVNAALERLGDDPEAHARFMLYWKAPAIDVAELEEEGRTGEGVGYVIRTSFNAAGVPVEHTDVVLKSASPMTLRALAVQLMSAGAAADAMREQSGDPGAKGNPTTGQSPTSGDSPTTTGTTAQPSQSSTPASTHAA